MNVLWDQPDHMPFVIANIPDVERGFSVCSTLGFYINTKLVAVMVFHNFMPQWGTIEITGAATSPLWARRAVFRFIAEYCFDINKCQAIVLNMADNNVRVQKLAKSLGFELTRVPRLRGQDAAAVIGVLTKEAWSETKYMR